MELSYEGDLLFLGGLQEEPNSEPSALLMVLNIATGLEVSLTTAYPQETGYQSISCMRRHPDCNVFFCGVATHLLILLWVPAKIIILNQVQISQENPLCDVCFQNNMVFGVNQTDKLVVVYFDSELLKQQLETEKVNPTRKEPLQIDQYFEKDNKHTLMSKEELGLAEEKGKNPGDSKGGQIEGRKSGRELVLNEQPSEEARNKKAVLRYPKFANLFKNYQQRIVNVPEGNWR